MIITIVLGIVIAYLVIGAAWFLVGFFGELL